MKTLSTQLMAHLAQPVTTLATCWKIIRTDGETFTFTTCDIPLTIDGLSYQSVAGFSRSAIQSGSTGTVDNLEVNGYFAETGILEQDLKNRLFDYATVFLFIVNWADLSMGICAMRRGWLGETVRSQSGGFVAELRGLTQALTQELGLLYSPLCRADLGDAKCKIPIDPPRWTANTAYTIGVAPGTYVQALVQSSDALIVAIFQLQTPGTSGASEPAWDTTIGDTTTDGTAVWVSVAPFRGLATVSTPIDQHTFVSSTLTIPAAAVVPTTNAVIGFANNVSAGSVIEISDGVVSLPVDFEFDTKGAGDPNNVDALHLTYNAIKSSALQMTVTFGPDATLILVNNSGHLGSIAKEGDTLGAIVISQFGAPLLDGGTVTWLSGENAGISMEMKTYDPNASVVTLWLGMNFPITAGDRFTYYPGCDKRRDTCFNQFNNILNFRGEPDMPGTDQILSYPDLAS